MTREKIKLVLDVPLSLRLEDARGAECHSQYTGTEWRYNVLTADGRPAWIYLPRVGHDAIQRSGAKDGDDIQVVKYLRDKATYCEVKVMTDAQEPPRNGHGVPALPKPEPMAAGLPRFSAAAPPQQQPAKPVRGSSHLAQALCQAIDAALEALEYAKLRNLAVSSPTFGDIRAMANTTLINDDRRAA